METAILIISGFICLLLLIFANSIKHKKIANKLYNKHNYNISKSNSKIELFKIRNDIINDSIDNRTRGIHSNDNMHLNVFNKLIKDVDTKIESIKI